MVYRKRLEIPIMVNGDKTKIVGMFEIEPQTRRILEDHAELVPVPHYRERESGGIELISFSLVPKEKVLDVST